MTADNYSNTQTNIKREKRGKRVFIEIVLFSILLTHFKYTLTLKKHSRLKKSICGCSACKTSL